MATRTTVHFLPMGNTTIPPVSADDVHVSHHQMTGWLQFVNNRREVVFCFNPGTVHYWEQHSVNEVVEPGIELIREV